MGQLLNIDSPTDKEFETIINYLQKNNTETLLQFLQFAKHQQWQQSFIFIEEYISKHFPSTLEVKPELLKYFDVPWNWKCIESFSCGYDTDIILSGSLYFWKEKICFHSYFNKKNLFFGQTYLNINFDDISRIEKRSFMLIESGICVITTDKQEYNFISFWQRDRTFEMLQTLLRLKGKNFEIDEQIQLANAQKFIKEIISHSDENCLEFYADSVSKRKQQLPSSSNSKIQSCQCEVEQIENELIQNEKCLKKLENFNKNSMTKFNEVCESLEKLDPTYIRNFQERKQKLEQLIFPQNQYKIAKQLVLDNCTMKQFFYYFLQDEIELSYQGKNYLNYQQLLQEQIGDKNINVGKWNPDPIAYFSEPENCNYKEILKNDFYTTKTVNFEHKSFEKNAFTPELLYNQILILFQVILLQVKALNYILFLLLKYGLRAKLIQEIKQNFMIVYFLENLMFLNKYKTALGNLQQRQMHIFQWILLRLLSCLMELLKDKQIKNLNRFLQINMIKSSNQFEIKFRSKKRKNNKYNLLIMIIQVIALMNQLILLNQLIIQINVLQKNVKTKQKNQKNKLNQ